MKFRLVAATGIALGLALTGCTGNASTPSGSNENDNDESGPIVIGMPIALTGFLNAFDANMLVGAKAAVERINADGGVLGRELVIKTSDTGTDVAQSTNSAIKLLDDGADFIIPTMDYDFGGPAARVAQQRGVITLGGAGDSRFGAQGIGDLVYNFLPASEVEGTVAAQFAVESQDWSRAYVLTQTDINHSTSVCGAFEESFTGLGGEVVGKDEFSSGDSSISAQISRIRDKADDVDFVMVCSVPPAGTSAMKEIRASGISLPLMLDDAYDGSYWLDGFPNESQIYTTGTGVPGDDPDATRTAVFEAYKAETGDAVPQTTSVLLGDTVVTALAKAIEDAGSTQTEDVKAALDSFSEVPLALGATTFTPDCHVSPRSLNIIHIKDGKQTYVETIEPTSVPEHAC
jgi:branched-chain amino acid transport system substrate-binding protein